MTVSRKERLFNDKEKYKGGAFIKDLLEQYKTYVVTADNVSFRRIITSRNMLVINSAFLTIYGYGTASGYDIASGYGIALSSSFMGLVVSWHWLAVIKYHFSLNATKYKIIKDIEEFLPANFFVCEREYHNSMRLHKLLDARETLIPCCFLLVHFCSFLFILLYHIVPLF